MIDQDELRFGKDSNQKRAFQCDDLDPRGKGDGGFYAQVSLTKWYHIDCLKLSQKARQQLLAQPNKLAGYTELSQADQQVRPHRCATLHVPSLSFCAHRSSPRCSQLLRRRRVASNQNRR